MHFTTPRWISLNASLCVVALTFVLTLQGEYLLTHPGMRIQAWSSDFMMQTLPAEALKEHPFGALWYEHIQPPLLDTLRATLLVFIPSGHALTYRLDIVMYIVHAILFSVLALLIFTAVRRLTGDVRYALAAWLVWVAHPAPLFYASLLEGTFLSAVVVTWFFYELWRASEPESPKWRVLVASILLIYTRTIFQWYFYPLLFIVWYLVGWRKREIIYGASIVLLCVVPLVAQRALLFDTLSTTTFAGYHKTGILWYEPTTQEVTKAEQELIFAYPKQAERYSGEDPYNTEQVYRDNLIYTKVAKEKVSTDPLWAVRQLTQSLAYNFVAYWKPSANYAKGAFMTNALPWKPLYDTVFGGVGLLALLLIALVSWWQRRNETEHMSRSRGLRILGFALLFGYILLISSLSNRGTWTEADRLKFILEPLFYVFIAQEIFFLLTRWYAAWRDGAR